MSYLIPAAVFEAELVVKKSRFIARVVPVTNREDVNAAVRQARADYPDARHHCWAYLLGRPADAASAGMSDDGEPAGTAGKPIMNVLQHGPFGDALVVVIRYFGGIKLGAGGLVRAYGSATRQVLDLAPAITRQDLQRFIVAGEFAAEQPLRHLLAGLGGEVHAVTYGEGVRLEITVPCTQAEELASFCVAHGLSCETP